MKLKKLIEAKSFNVNAKIHIYKYGRKCWHEQKKPKAQWICGTGCIPDKYINGTVKYITTDPAKDAIIVEVKPAKPKAKITNPENAVLKEGRFVSVWDGGTVIETCCTANMATRHLEIERSDGAEIEGLNTLDEEYVLIDGKRYPVSNGDRIENGFWYD